ncbi:MAG: hypothetical protein Q4G70_13700 [Pseudomonadota bacterium]|nr:hypothetical protein [Pseudomonadota bacterium]
MTDVPAAAATKKPRAKRRTERLNLLLSHKRDLQMWDEIRQRPEYADMGVSEVVRHAIRTLYNEHRTADQLDGYEKRMGASLRAMHKHLNRMENAQQINMAFLEVLMRTYYYHTVPVPKEAAPQAVADANRRIARFIEDVAGMLERGGGIQELTIRMMEMESDEAAE